MKLRAAPALLLLALASCSTLQDPTVQAPGDPAGSVVVFGSLAAGCLLDEPIERIVIVQVDPSFPEARIEPTWEGSMFFTEPLPVGPSWRIVSAFVGEEELRLSFDFHPGGPGLLFLGSLEVPMDDSHVTEMRRVARPSERELLQSLLDFWRGTVWEELVRDRIRRLNYLSR